MSRPTFKVSNPDAAKKEMQTNNRDSYINPEIRFFRPQSKIRNDWSIQIFPGTWEDAEFFAYTAWVHHNIGMANDKASYLCLYRMKNEKCPICEEVEKMVRKGANPDDIKVISAKETKIFYVRDLDNNTQETPYVWAASPNIIENIVKVSYAKIRGKGNTGVIEKYLPPDDPDAGRCLSFNVVGQGMKTRYSGYKIDNIETPFDDADLEFVVEHPIPSILKYYDYDYIKGKISVFSSPKDEVSEEEENVATTRHSTKPTEVVEEEVSESGEEELVEDVTEEKEEPKLSVRDRIQSIKSRRSA